MNSSSLQLSPQIDIAVRSRPRPRAQSRHRPGRAGGTRRVRRYARHPIRHRQRHEVRASSLSDRRPDQPRRAALDRAAQPQTGAIVHLGDVAVLENNPARAADHPHQPRNRHSHQQQRRARCGALERAGGFKQRVAALHLPNTVHVGPNAGGTQQNLTQTVNGLGVSLLLSFTLVYLLMVALYDATARRSSSCSRSRSRRSARSARWRSRTRASTSISLIGDGHARRPREQERHPARRLRPSQGSARRRQASPRLNKPRANASGRSS